MRMPAGVRVEGSRGLRVRVLGCSVGKLRGCEFGVYGSGCQGWDLGCGGSCIVFRVSCFVFQVSGFVFRVSGFRL